MDQNQTLDCNLRQVQLSHHSVAYEWTNYLWTAADVSSTVTETDLHCLIFSQTLFMITVVSFKLFQWTLWGVSVIKRGVPTCVPLCFAALSTFLLFLFFKVFSVYPCVLVSPTTHSTLFSVQELQIKIALCLPQAHLQCCLMSLVVVEQFCFTQVNFTLMCNLIVMEFWK